MKKPLITIGITSFNSEETIERAVKSSLSQLWRPIEIIIIDDFSTDEGYKILKNLRNQNSEIFLFRNLQNRGVAFSRNKIIEESRGEFLAFFDDDDVSLPERLDSQYKRIIEYENKFANGSCVICHTSRKIIYENKKTFIENTMGENQYLESPNGIKVAKRILYGNPLTGGYGSLATCSQMARLKTYKLVGGFDNLFKRSEDTDLTIRLASKGAHFVGIKKPLVMQYMTKTKEKNFENELEFFRMVIKKHKKFMNSRQYKFALKWLDIKYIAYKGQIVRLGFFVLAIIFSYPKLSINRLFHSIRNITKNFYFFHFHTPR